MATTACSRDMLERLEVYTDEQALSAPLNMAVDEALFEKASVPAIRFYAWARPALSFGYFGRLADARAAGSDRELVRRWTGGGIVLHGSDLTYSLVLPACHKSSAHPARKIYGEVHAALAAAFRQIGVTADLLEAPAPKISEACFANPVPADLVVGDRKVAGAAQRRTRVGLLQQGSIQFDDLPPDFAARFASALSSRVEFCSPEAETLRRAESIAMEKYGTRVWLERR
jgi:lipoyl(octanoyl) transferase